MTEKSTSNLHIRASICPDSASMMLEFPDTKLSFESPEYFALLMLELHDLPDEMDQEFIEGILEEYKGDDILGSGPGNESQSIIYSEDSIHGGNFSITVNSSFGDDDVYLWTKREVVMRVPAQVIKFETREEYSEFIVILWSEFLSEMKIVSENEFGHPNILKILKLEKNDLQD